MDDVTVNAVWPVVVYDLDVICVNRYQQGWLGRKPKPIEAFENEPGLLNGAPFGVRSFQPNRSC